MVDLTISASVTVCFAVLVDGAIIFNYYTANATNATTISHSHLQADIEELAELYVLEIVELAAVVATVTTVRYVTCTVVVSPLPKPVKVSPANNVVEVVTPSFPQ